MNSHEMIVFSGSILPALIGGGFTLFALFGIGELLKEAKVALRKEVKI
tara:strand:+ start:171 stop:314 length:144 start_codon:yes stop_codon:yes gene_type:complete